MWTDEVTRVISTITGMHGVRLAYHISLATRRPIFFSKQSLTGNIPRKFQKNRSTKFILKNHLNYNARKHKGMDLPFFALKT